MTNSPIACPQCGLADPVQKVSVLYEGNTKEWTETTGSGDSRSTVVRQAKTLLGQRLTPPPKPSAGLDPKWLWWGGCGVLAFIALTGGIPACIGLVAAIIGLLVPLGIVAVGVSETGVAPPAILEQLNLPDWAGWAGAACLGLGLLIVLVVGAWLTARVVGWLRAQYSLSLQNHQQRVAETEAELPRWERALEKWKQLYYCTRDDVVFVAGKRPAPSAEMLKYLYEI
jgi:hypothetical protein